MITLDDLADHLNWIYPYSQFEWNARTQITMWFDNTEVEASLLRDYGMYKACAFVLFSRVLHGHIYPT